MHVVSVSSPDIRYIKREGPLISFLFFFLFSAAAAATRSNEFRFGCCSQCTCDVTRSGPRHRPTPAQPSPIQSLPRAKQKGNKKHNWEKIFPPTVKRNKKKEPVMPKFVLVFPNQTKQNNKNRSYRSQQPTARN